MTARLLYLFTALLLALSWGIAFRQAAGRDQLRAKQTQVFGRRSETTLKLHQLKARLRENEKREAELQVKIAALAATVPAPKAARVADFIDIQERLDTEPALQVQEAKVARNVIKINYAPFYRMQGMTDAEIAEFEEFLVRRDEEQKDIFATMRSQKLSPQDPAFGTLFKTMMERYRDAQTQLLGKDGYDQLLEYEKTRQLRQFIDGVAGAATVAGAPFSPKQAEQLIQLMAASVLKKQHTSPIFVQQVNWDAVDKQAREILSPEQLVAFQTLESRGLNSVNSRELTWLNNLISQAAEEERKAKSPAKPWGG